VQQPQPLADQSRDALQPQGWRFLAANDMPAGIDDVTTESIRAFLVAERERTTAAYSQQHYRNLSVFWNWLAAEGERAGENPMTRVSKPEVPVRMEPFFTEDDLAKLLRATSGQDFVVPRRAWPRKRGTLR
jgi:integrase/recombinase XerD